MYNANTINKPIWPYTLDVDLARELGLVGWWPGEPANTSYVFDLSGRGHHLAMASATPGSPPVPAPGYGGGQAVDFTAATSQYANIALPILTAGPLTMMCWFRSKDIVTNGRVLDINNSGATTDYLNIQANAGNLTVQHRVSASNTTATATGYNLANVWQHVAGTMDASNIGIWVNGILRASAGGSGAGMVGANVFTMGRLNNSAPTQYINGSIEEACLFNRALSPAEIWARFDPKTRWDLRYKSKPTRYFFGGGAAPPATTGTPILLGGILQSPIIQGVGGRGGIVS